MLNIEIEMEIEIETEDTKTEIGEVIRVTVRIVFTAIAGFHRRKPVGCSDKENDFIERETVIIKTTVMCLTENETDCKGNTTNIVAT